MCARRYVPTQMEDQPDLISSGRLMGRDAKSTVSQTKVAVDDASSIRVWLGLLEGLLAQQVLHCRVERMEIWCSSEFASRVRGV